VSIEALTQKIKVKEYVPVIKNGGIFSGDIGYKRDVSIFDETNIVCITFTVYG
jgi:hypothetical protein